MMKKILKARCPRLYALLRARYMGARSLARALKRHRYINRTYHFRADTPALYLSNSKAACSSIKASMHGLNGAKDYQQVHGEVYRLGQIAKNLGPEDHPGWFRFTFVRDPFERLVSCYENKYHSDQALLGGELKRLHYDEYLLGILRKARIEAFARSRAGYA